MKFWRTMCDATSGGDKGDPEDFSDSSQLIGIQAVHKNERPQKTKENLSHTDVAGQEARWKIQRDPNPKAGPRILKPVKRKLKQESYYTEQAKRANIEITKRYHPQAKHVPLESTVVGTKSPGKDSETIRPILFGCLPLQWLHVGGQTEQQPLPLLPPSPKQEQEAAQAASEDASIACRQLNGEKPIIVTKTADGIKPCILLIIGAQGAGKSTFAKGLVESGFLPWVRINQDVIRNGQRGTRRECVLLTAQKLSEGYCCVVDRMNFTNEQRLDFIELAQELHVPIHCVILQAEFRTLVYRVAQRVNHEGNFQGYSKKNRNIISKTRHVLISEGWPQGWNEGFASMKICCTNEDIAAQMLRWLNWGRTRKRTQLGQSIGTGEKEGERGVPEPRAIGFVPDYVRKMFVDGDADSKGPMKEAESLAKDACISIAKLRPEE